MAKDTEMLHHSTSKRYTNECYFNRKCKMKNLSIYKKTSFVLKVREVGKF